MTFGEKLKEARKKAGLTQEELAELIGISRAAVAKWETDNGLPDIENLKTVAGLLDVSVDYLLDDGESLDLYVIKKAIDLNKYGNGEKLSRMKKLEIKERIVRDTYPDAEIIRLTLTGIRNTKRETVVDQVIGWFALLLGGIPLFGTQEVGKLANSLDQQYYLVNEEKSQYFILITDEHIVARKLPERISKKKFEIGDKKFQVMGNVK
ncbi:MAG: helix-turn-helix domain-containing protein [Erysipelotrichaceae bacterium]|nr:helix-turn-helix domain-containing protein [Erysipelotrichaceae bacterium]